MIIGDYGGIQVRAARPQIMLNGVDFYQQLAPYLLHFEYTDSCDGAKADDCQFSLADRDRKFINEWMPAPGATFDAAILAERWFSPNAATLQLPCGTFYIDSIEFDLPQHTVHVKACSIPNDSHGKTSNDTHGWGEGEAGNTTGTTLKDIAGRIAQANNLQLDYPDGLRNPKYDRVEQVQESAFQFLKRICEDAKLEIKIAHGFLHVYDPLTFDQQAPSFTLVYGNGAAGVGMNTYQMTGARFRFQVTDLTASTVVSNTDIDTGDTTSQQFDANSLLPSQVGGTGGSAGGGSQGIPGLPSAWKDHLNWNCDVTQSGGGDQGSPPSGSLLDTSSGGLQYFSDDPAEGSAALTKAQARTRDKNKRHYESDIELSIGNPLIAAGQTFMLSGCGQFDGLWFIETAHHELCPMYKTTIHVRRTLAY
jgi:phage protein D